MIFRRYFNVKTAIDGLAARRHAGQPGMPRACIWYHGMLGLPAASPPCHASLVRSRGCAAKLDVNHRLARMGVYRSGCASTGTPSVYQNFVRAIGSTKAKRS
jgi:hypothetical protein